MTETEQQAYARRYKWIRENWDAISGLTWSEPIAPMLDAHVDAMMAGIDAAERAFGPK